MKEQKVKGIYKWFENLPSTRSWNVLMLRMRILIMIVFLCFGVLVFVSVFVTIPMTELDLDWADRIFMAFFAVISFIPAMLTGMSIHKTLKINRLFQDISKLSKKLNKHYVDVLITLKESIKEPFLIDYSELIKEIEVGDLKSKNEKISIVLKTLVNVLDRLKWTGKIGYGSEYIASLSNIIQGLEGIKNVHVKGIRDEIVKGVLIKLIDEWMDRLIKDISLASRQARLKTELRTKDISLRTSDVIELSIVNLGGPAWRIGVAILPSSDYTVKDEPLKNVESLNEEETDLLRYEIVPLSLGSLSVNFEITYYSAKTYEEQKIRSSHSVFVSEPAKEIEFKKIGNPYIFGPPIKDPKMFYGRTEEIDRIKKEIVATSFQKQDFAILGQRRIGKTSMLYQLKGELDEKYLTVFIDVQNIEPKEPKILFINILNEIKKEILKKYDESVLPIFSVLEREKSNDDLEYTRFNDDLEKLTEIIQSGRLPKIVFLIDEVETLTKFKGLGMLDFFRSLIQKFDDIIFIVVGSDRLYELTTDYSSPFFNVFKTVELKELIKPVAKKLIKEPSEENNVDFTGNEDRVVELTGGNPYLIQAVCQYIINLLNTERKNIVTLTDVENAAKSVVREQHGFFKDFWKETTKEGKLILFYLTENGIPSTAEEISSHIRKNTDGKISLEDLAKNFEKLEERNLIQKGELMSHLQSKQSRPNAYWFKIELFPWWISENIKLKDLLLEVRL
jgi:GTPase SAR1 family protein